MNKSDKTRSYRKTKPQRKRERDTFPGAKKRVWRTGFWLQPEAKRWYILIGLCAIISVLLFPNILNRPKIYELGDVAKRDIKASREFLVEDDELTEKNRQAVVKGLPPVYDFDPTATSLVARIREAFDQGRQYLAAVLSVVDDQEKTEPNVENAPSKDIDVFKNNFFEILDIPPDDNIFAILVKNGFPSESEGVAISLITKVLGIGVVSNKKMLMNHSGKGIILRDIYTGKESRITDLDRFNDPGAATDLVKNLSRSLRDSRISEELSEVSLKLAIMLIKPNLTFNKRETELRKDLTWKSVKPFYFIVKKGEMLVREGERITPEHLLKLSEQYKLLEREEMLGRAPAMAVLIGFLISAMYLAGLMTGRSTKAETRDFLFNAATLLVVFLVVMASNFVSEETARGFDFFAPRALLFAVPVASGAMLVSVFQGMGVAASFSLIASVLASLVVGGQVEFFIYFFISSLVAAYGVKNCRERGIFIRTGLKVGVSNIVLALSIEALSGSFNSIEALIAFASAFIGGILVGIIATGLLPLIEMSFGYTTDIKLLELANLDQPLLRELMVQAPGTHHHSVIVSNLVEASAQAVDANPLLAKVAAYYHDIGKIKKPIYFIENQANCGNKHEKLAPSMSSLILISHIKDGVELAEKHKLGREIIDIIRQHHGTSLITFFYEKAKEQGEKKGGKTHRVKEEDFRYPGPKPQTKEAALVLLADVVEAASRTLVDPTAARIQGMVQNMINKVFSDGQLTECELTLKDFHEIAKSFNKTLSGIFHHRLEYPEPVIRTAPAKMGGNGNTDQISTGDSWAENSEDKAQAGESLKRLGLS
jgi:putative nucleotidyltransferase with HDIG domain